MNAPTTSTQFDAAYQAPLTLWGDWRIPREVKDLAANKSAARALELGCGIGRNARYLARHGLSVVGIDFSPVAIARAKARVASDTAKPEFLVDDVRDLSRVAGPFDVSLDVGCFHCLDQDGQRRYATALARLLEPGAKHLIWAMDDAPSALPMHPEAITPLFEPFFSVARVEKRRRRLVPSWWYWLARTSA